MSLHQQLSGTVLTAMLLGMTCAPASVSAAFSDVRPSVTPSAKAILRLQERGILDGYADGTYKPGATLNRAEFLKIVLEARGGDIEGQDCFPDVNDEWFAQYICSALDDGIVGGYPDGFFRPERTINFVEASKILANAFDQPIETYSPDWYEPYARALETSKAIPLSIERLDEEITRGEMAEMMWRLTDAVTTEPSKGYINVKYPEVAINLSGNEPQHAKSCADLRAFTEEANRGGGPVMMRDMMEDGGGSVGGTTGGIPPMMAPQSAEKSATANSGGDADFSGTNVQVQGVDEADVVKTDGTFVYAIIDGTVKIVRAKPADKMETIATLNLRSQGVEPQDLYVDAGRLIVIGSTWNSGDIVPMRGENMKSAMIWPGPTQQRTQVRIYSTVDNAPPVLERTLSFDGNRISTRRIDDRLYVVLNQYVGWYGPRPVPVPLEADLLPRFSDSAHNSSDQPVARCGDVVILPHVPNPSYLIVAAIPLEENDPDVERTVILGQGENVYASLENLYVAATQWNYDWRIPEKSGQRTALYRFSLDKGVPFEAQGFVDGHLLNQFSMDEFEGNLRLAATIDTNSQASDSNVPSTKNAVFILNPSMTIIGTVSDIAPGEKIYSSRFMGKRGYLVTFRSIDPLFALDLSNPQDPKILGQLKIPGYSDYIHPYDDTHLIGFGKEAFVGKDGQTAWFQGMKMALFDVTDPTKPTEIDSVTIGDRGTDSPLLRDHHALLFDRERNLISFPVNVHTITEEQKRNGDPLSTWGDPSFQGAYVFTIDPNKGFTQRGTITHYTQQDLLKAGSYFYGKDIERILRLDESLVTVSQDGVQSNALKDLAREGGVTFKARAAEGDCPDPNAPGVKYVSQDLDECARVRFSCVAGSEGFSNECGCGCVEE